MVRSVRESYDENQAAGRLRVPLAAWRWAVGHLARAGLLVRLGGDAECPDVHPDQVAALARRRDLPALLDRHVPLGPDQAARRLGVRRVDFDQVVRLGWVAPVGSVQIDYKRQGGVTTVPLYSAEDVALLPVVRPTVDWRVVYAVPAGRRSPLAGLEPAPVWERVLLAEVARMARVGRAAVVNWCRWHPDFPAPVDGTDVHPQFDRAAVVAWLLAHDKIEVPVAMPSASLVVVGAGGRTFRFRLDGPWLDLADDAEGEDQLSGWSTDADADELAALAAGEFGTSVGRLTAPGTVPLAVLGEVRVIERFRSGSGGLRVTLAWPAGLRGAAADGSGGGVVRHEVPYVGLGEECVCRRHDCGGLVLVTRAPSTAGLSARCWSGTSAAASAARRCTAAVRRARTWADWAVPGGPGDRPAAGRGPVPKARRSITYSVSRLRGWSGTANPRVTDWTSLPLRSRGRAGSVSQLGTGSGMTHPPLPGSLFLNVE
ncbi:MULTISPECIES: hypothetical protein [unclassified Streptomyces]|uniref:hypothetical protein n=1 Tax=unclassified Streptomyces TaxID=2593676 RepID=UPI002E31EA60|nr:MULTISPECIES: hypothetical protein [unclassified Streptomyces]